LSKTEIAFRLSGALSVRSACPRANPTVLETFVSYPFRSTTVNPLPTQDFHEISTAETGMAGDIFWAHNRTHLPFFARPNTDFTFCLSSIGMRLQTHKRERKILI
jgi:hypothetical protein